MKLSVYDKTAKEVAKVDLPDVIFGADWNADLVHQVVVGYQSNQRQGNAHTKHRGEVSGTGKKPWRQKGTGNARHGSRRSPIWVGGGVAHGPRNDRNYHKNINVKMKRKALATVLSKKVADGRVLGLDTLSFESPNTKTANIIFNSLQAVKGFETLTTLNPNNVLVVTPQYDKNALLSVRNLGYASIKPANEINANDIIMARYIVMVDPQAVADHLAERLPVSKVAA